MLAVRGIGDYKICLLNSLRGFLISIVLKRL